MRVTQLRCVTVSDDPNLDEPTSRVRPVDLRDYASFADGPATRVRVLASDHLAVDLWCLEPRATSPVLHLPETDVTYTVIGGRSWFVTDDGEVGLDPLGAVLVPAGVVHGFENRSPDPLIVVASSAPPSDVPEDAPTTAHAAAVHRATDGPGPLRRFLDRLLGPAWSGDPGAQRTSVGRSDPATSAPEATQQEPRR